MLEAGEGMIGGDANKRNIAHALKRQGVGDDYHGVRRTPSSSITGFGLALLRS